MPFNLPPLDRTTVTGDARAMLDGVHAKFGFVPNMLAVMASAPPVLDAYLTLADLLDRTSFSQTERQVLALSISTTNHCEYCVAAHSTIAAMHDVPNELVAALRDGSPLADPKLESLRCFAVAVTETRGVPSERITREFLEHHRPPQALEVILAVAMKTLSNYTNHLAEPELDAPFRKESWEPTTV